jgi:hypothetical protein
MLLAKFLVSLRLKTRLNMHLKKIIPIVIAMFALPIIMKAQVTTGIITGIVKSEDGKGLSGATITATLESTGSVYKTASKSNGQFTIPNLRVGGPYEVKVSFVGYASESLKDIEVTLGTPVKIDFSLKSSSQDLGVVTVTGKANKGVINSQRNGTSTNISARLVQALPTINRSVQDFARLTPQVRAGNSASSGNVSGLSFAGQSNRYNQFTIDGANASDAFGLGSSGTNGGQANVNPISIDAIQEIQIILSPYDVTQGGFTGGGINAVSKSGTNKFHGSAYGQLQNQKFIGKSNVYNSTIISNPVLDFTNQTYGASLGGAIVKNKLFFFTNVERFEKSTPLAFDPTIAGSGSRANADTLEAIRQFMIKNYYDPGTYGAINNKNQSTSVFARLDWNINDKHKLTLRHNYVKGSNDILSRSATSVVFSNTGYKFTTESNSTVLELNSSFSSSASNIFRLTYNQIRDRRISNLFGALTISNYDLAQATNITYNLGSDFSSQANSLNQDVFTVTNNFTLYKGKHTLTIGTNNEFFKTENVFLQGFNGSYTYAAGANSRTNIDNFYNNRGMTGYSVGYSTSGRGDKASADLKAAQLAFYVQDVYAINKDFKLTYGLRVDLPIISSKPIENAAFNAAFAAYDVKTDQMPATKLLFSPRVGFNWDVEGNGEMQIRGGAGLFTGRVPFVWISNQLSNTGIATKNNNFTAAQIITAGIKYTYDPTDPQAGAYIPPTSAAVPTIINVVDKNFKYPQVFRANIAADKKVGNGFITTFELLFTKNINNANYTNLNISDDGETKTNLGPTSRPLWTKYTNPAYVQVIKLGNTSEGYSASFTAQIQKTYTKGWSGSIAYTYGTAASLTDLPSSVALSNWRGVQTVNGLNKTDFATSNFNMGSRVVGYISKEIKYANNFATTITLIYTGQSGQRLSYMYGGVNLGAGNNFAGNSTTITGDDASTTSLAYLPANFTEANFADLTGGKTASQQWADYQEFSAANSYLKDNAGRNAERNGDKLPFENHFDLRVAQDFKFKNHKLQVYFDLINFGALLNNTLGRAYGSNSDGFFPVTNVLFTPVIGAQRKDGVAFTATATQPAFQFNINNFTKINDTFRPYNIADFTSRWNGQIGVRYSF